MTVPRLPSAAAAVVAGVLSVSCHRSEPRDVVIVTLDTVRADRLGCYGRAGATTPHLDALAGESVLFEDASCATPITLPSHATLFTGRYPTTTGVRNNGSFVLPASETTLAEVLKSRDWSTAAVVAAFPLQRRYGLAQGFDVYDDELPPLPLERGQAFSIHFSERDARTVTDRALEIWGRPAKGPRFLWVHYFDAHAPYDPPEPYRSAHAGSPYEGEIAFVDAELGRLLDRIERDAPNAIVVVAGDHGEGLGEHGEKTHGFLLYQSTVHVPLLVRAPGAFPAGKRIAEPVSLADVMPSVLALLGVPAPAGMDGGDLGPLVRSGERPKHREVYAETYLPRLQFRFSPLTMLRSGTFKYISAPSAELYDLKTDPQETRSLGGAASDDGSLAERLRDFVARSDAGASARATGTLDAEGEARLKSLGYAASGSLGAGSGGGGRDPKTMTGYLERYDRAVGLVAAGRVSEGLTALRELVPEVPENYMARYQLAAALIVLGRRDEARTELAQVVAAAPEFGSGHLMLAECLADLGRLEEAVTSFDAAAALLPAQAEPKLAEGRALERRGRFDAAAAAYRQAIEREPGSTESAVALAALRAGRGATADAIRELRALAGRFPGSAALWTVLAESLHRSADDRGAAEAVSRALALEPERIDARLLKAGILLSAGRGNDAAAAYRGILDRQPGSKVAALGYGRALVLGSNAAEANAWARRLRALYPNDPAPLVLLGVLSERGGDSAAAADLYHAALELDPADPDARRGLDRLGNRR
jgi:arylsulfatase A-like enzyme/Flp pilus assembly protein TadD